MNKQQLKLLIKPLVKECITEVLIEDGHLSSIVSEVASGLVGQPLLESQKHKLPPATVTDEKMMREQASKSREKLGEHRRKLLDSIGNEAFNGVDLFEGTQPLTNREAATPSNGAIDLGDSNDAGVNIDSLIGGATAIWKGMK